MATARDEEAGTLPGCATSRSGPAPSPGAAPGGRCSRAAARTSPRPREPITRRSARSASTMSTMRVGHGAPGDSRISGLAPSVTPGPSAPGRPSRPVPAASSGVSDSTATDHAANISARWTTTTSPPNRSAMSPATAGAYRALRPVDRDNDRVVHRSLPSGPGDRPPVDPRPACARGRRRALANDLSGWGRTAGPPRRRRRDEDGPDGRSAFGFGPCTPPTVTSRRRRRPTVRVGNEGRCPYEHRVAVPARRPITARESDTLSRPDGAWHATTSARFRCATGGHHGDPHRTRLGPRAHGSRRPGRSAGPRLHDDSPATVESTPTAGSWPAR